MLLNFCSGWAPVVSGRNDDSQPGFVVGRSHSRCSYTRTILSIGIGLAKECCIIHDCCERVKLMVVLDFTTVQ